MNEFQRMISLVPELHKQLAEYYEVAPSTVVRWGSGVAVPHPKMQQCIMNTLEKMAGLCKCGLCIWCKAKAAQP